MSAVHVNPPELKLQPFVQLPVSSCYGPLAPSAAPNLTHKTGVLVSVRLTAVRLAAGEEVLVT